MNKHLFVKVFEKRLIEIHVDTIISAPINSMTPVFHENENGNTEMIFIVKAEEWLYEPLKNKSIDDKVRIGAKAYMEGSSLIFGFDVEPDINLESEIPSNRIKQFLSQLKNQDILTIVVMNPLLNTIWMTNDYPFWKVKDKFFPLFNKYNV